MRKLTVRGLKRASAPTVRVTRLPLAPCLTNFQITKLLNGISEPKKSAGSARLPEFLPPNEISPGLRKGSSPPTLAVSSWPLPPTPPGETLSGRSSLPLGRGGLALAGPRRCRNWPTAPSGRREGECGRGESRRPPQKPRRWEGVTLGARPRFLPPPAPGSEGGAAAGSPFPALPYTGPARRQPAARRRYLIRRPAPPARRRCPGRGRPPVPSPRPSG